MLDYNFQYQLICFRHQFPQMFGAISFYFCYHGNQIMRTDRKKSCTAVHYFMWVSLTYEWTMKKWPETVPVFYNIYVLIKKRKKNAENSFKNFIFPHSYQSGYVQNDGFKSFFCSYWVYDFSTSQHLSLCGHRNK